MFRCRRKVEKLRSPEIWGQGKVPPPKKIFFAKMRFFEWAFEKDAFLETFLGGSPHPQFFFSKIVFLDANVFL